MVKTVHQQLAETNLRLATEVADFVHTQSQRRRKGDAVKTLDTQPIIGLQESDLPARILYDSGTYASIESLADVRDEPYRVIDTRVRVIMTSEVVNSETKRTIREEELAKPRKFKIGDLVEINHESSKNHGLRLYVTNASLRDCDGSHMYYLGTQPIQIPDSPKEQVLNFLNSRDDQGSLQLKRLLEFIDAFYVGVVSGYGEESLELVRRAEDNPTGD